MNQTVSDQDRRRSQRKSPAHKIMVDDTVTAEPFGQLGNLSNEGLMIISRALIEEGLVFQLGFSLNDANGHAHRLDVGALCLWCMQANSPGAYWSGFEIIDISDDDADLLRELINQL